MNHPFSLLSLRCGVLLASTVVAGSLQADWKQFRGSAGDSVEPGSRIPSQLDARSTVWSAALPGRGISSPVIVGDRVFVTSCSGGRQDRLHVLCFNLSDGSLRWERKFWATGRTMTHEKISGAAPSPATDGHRIFAFFSSNDCVALDLDGNLLWYRGLGRDYPNASNSLGMASSLSVIGEVVVAQVENDSESFAAGLDARTGTNVWKLDRPKRANWTSPFPFREADGRISAILQSSKGVVAIDPATGQTRWSYTDGASTAPSSTSAGGRIYVPSQGLTVLEPVSGAAPKQIWRSSQLRPGTASPVVVGGKIFTLNDGGILSCGDIADGRRLWQLRLKGSFSSTPVSAGGFLYCINEDGLVQVIDPSTPTGSVVSELPLNDIIIGTPSIAGDSLLIRSDKKLWRIGRNSSL